MQHSTECITASGKTVLIDKSDFDVVAQHKWRISGSGYAISTINGKDVLMHRFILGAVPGEILDHINCDKLDNRRGNLRKCTSGQNCANRGMSSNNKSGYKGVWINGKRKSKMWRASIRVSNKTIHLGGYDDKASAAMAYNAAAVKYFGEFARLNDV